MAERFAGPSFSSVDAATFLDMTDSALRKATERAADGRRRFILYGIEVTLVRRRWRYRFGAAWTNADGSPLFWRRLKQQQTILGRAYAAVLATLGRNSQTVDGCEVADAYGVRAVKFGDRWRLCIAEQLRAGIGTPEAAE